MAEFRITTNHPYLWLDVAYSWGTADLRANTTPLTVTLTLHHQEISLGAGTDDCQFSVGGITTKWTGPSLYATKPNVDTVLGTKTVQVPHGADGKFSGTLEVRYRFANRYGSYTIANPITGSASITAPVIPRVSVPTASAAAAYLGDGVILYTNRKSQAFTHVFRYAFEGASGEIARKVGDSFLWTLPYDLAKRIPAKTKGSLAVYCDTYSGSTLLGTESLTIAVTVPDNDITKPSLNPSLSPWGDLPEVFSGLYIQGKTAVQGVFHPESAYSTVKKCTMTVGSKTYPGDPAVSELLGASGEMAVTCTVTDARGYSRSVTIPIAVQAYFLPRLEDAKVYRCNGTGAAESGGTYVKISLKKVFAPLDGKNTCTVTRQHRPEGGSYSPEAQILDGDTAVCDLLLGDIAPDPEVPYRIRFVLRDGFGEPVYLPFDLPSRFHTLHLGAGGRGIAFGKKAGADGFDCNMPARFRKAVSFDIPFSGVQLQSMGLVESGTWEPTLVSGGTGLPCLGTYFRTGNLVHVTVSCAGKFTSRDGNQLAFSLPFPAASQGSYGCFGHSDAGMGDLCICARQQMAVVSRINANGTEEPVTGSQVGDRWNFRFSLTYGTNLR